MSRRTSARIVLLDEDGCVLLFCGSDPATESDEAPHWWFTVGGAVQPGEPLPEAAVRELAEETGLRVSPADLIGPVWRRDAVIDFNGSVMRSEELFFVYRTARFEPSTSGHTAAGTPLHPRPPLVRRGRHRATWSDGGETVYPLQLGELARRRPSRWPTRRIGCGNRRRTAIDSLSLRIKSIWPGH